MFNQNWNHESCHFDVDQPCRFVLYVLEMFNKRRDDVVALQFLHLCCYLLSTKDTQLSRPRFEFIVIYSYINVYSGLKSLLLQNKTPLQGKVQPPSPLNFAETMCDFDTDFTWKFLLKLLSIEQWQINKTKTKWLIRECKLSGWKIIHMHKSIYRQQWQEAISVHLFKSREINVM